MPASRMTCPSCGAELTYDARRAFKGHKEETLCPYLGLAYPELRAGHDQIYFGRWRRMDATSVDIRRGYHQMGRHLSALAQALAGKDLPAAGRDLERAVEAFRAEDPRDESQEFLRTMDHALSYAHRALDDLLHEMGLPPHDPMVFADWYDAGEVPFRDAW